MVVATSPPPRSPQRTSSRANPLRLNILPVSTFNYKILRCVQQRRVNKLKDLGALTTGASFQTTQNAPLIPTLSRFYVQLLSIQRFFSCLPAKLMIPKDHERRGIPNLIPLVTVVASSTSTNRLSSGRSRFTSAFPLLPSAFAQLSPVLSRFYPQLLSIQRFCSCSRANPMIPKDHRDRGIYAAAHFELIPSMLSPSLWESGKIEA